MPSRKPAVILADLLAELSFLQVLTNLAVEKIQPRKIWIFGSRARGDHQPRSDVDIAFDTACSQPAWADFKLDADEHLPTLLDIDMVRWADASDELRTAILRDGVLIYDSETDAKARQS